MKKIELQYNPFSSKIEKKEIKKDFINWYDNKFKKITLDKRLAISGEVAEEEVRKICEKFGITDWQKIGFTARIFRDVFCGDLKESGIQKIALEKIKIKQEDLKVFLQLIKGVIKVMKQAGEKEYNEIIDKLTLKEAVRLYPEIQEQKISDEALRLESKDYLVAGNVKNWLTDYFQKAGGNKHTSLERSDYLFQSESVKGLSQKEKEDLGVILKAFDDDSLVAIDKENKEINFDESRELDNGKKALNGIIESYDNGFLDQGLIKNKKTENNLTQNKNNFKQKEDFTSRRIEKIKSTPNFEVDNNTKKNNSETSNENVVSLKKEDFKKQKMEIENKKKRNEKNQNVLDLSDFV